MKIESGINPNCSECAFVIYKDKLDKKTRDFIEEFIVKEELSTMITPKGNISIETGIDNNPDDKSELWSMSEKIKYIADWTKINWNEGEQYYIHRDDSYYDAIKDGNI